MSGYSITPTAQDMFLVLQAWIMAVTGLTQQQVLQANPNRTPAPVFNPGYCVMFMSRTNRLRTPIDTWDTTNPNPTTLSSETGTRVLIQLDFYSSPGANPSAFDWAQAVSGLWRDEATCAALTPTCQPLHADEAFQAPLTTDEEEQYEQRWTLTAYVQYNPVTSVPMQFADQAEVALVNVDKAYPP